MELRENTIVARAAGICERQRTSVRIVMQTGTLSALSRLTWRNATDVYTERGEWRHEGFEKGGCWLPKVEEYSTPKVNQNDS
jgi:hypothetical protein